MLLNVNYIKVLSTITIVFICINNSYSDITKIDQSDIKRKLVQLSNKQVTIQKPQEFQNTKQNLTLLEQNTTNNQQTMHEVAPSNTQYRLKRNNAITQSKHNELSNQQLRLNTNNNTIPASVVKGYENTTTQVGQSEQITPFPLGYKNYTPQPEEQYKQFITEANKIIEQINTNKNNILNAFNKSFENRSIKNKIFYKQKGEDTKAILKILLDNYSKLYNTSQYIYNKVNDYNTLSKDNYNIKNINQKLDDISISTINVIQQLEYDKYITNILKTVIDNYNTTNRDYKKEGWYTQKEFNKFCTLLSNYINDFGTLRTQFIELCNKYLGGLQQQVQQQLSKNQRKQLNNCTSNSIQYITNTIDDILSIMDNQFDTKKMGKNTSELKKILLENKNNLSKISEYISNFLKHEIID